MTDDTPLKQLIPSDDDAALTAAFSLASNPGAYALLIGAGVSKGAGLPTAWDVLNSLCAQAAELAGEAPDDPVDWFGKMTGSPATYQTVLKRLAPTTHERQALLRPFFEPASVGEPDVHPSQAHHAIARLVRAGSVRLIVTLNFDRLIERALRENGVEPLVIASEAEVADMPPLHTVACCVVHLHGDYLNPSSMLNTVEELDQYTPARRSLLSRIVSEYGLIAAGWSARYDTALRDALLTSYPARYTLTWIEPGAPTEEAEQLRLAKQGVRIALDGNAGFSRLADAVDSLRSRRGRHPLTLPTAVETAKRALSGGPVSIQLHDAVTSELQRLHAVEDIRNPSGQSDDPYPEIVARVEEAVSVVDGLIGTLAFWGDERTDRWWLGELPRFALHGNGSGSTVLLRRRFIAGSAMFYTAGVCAVAAERFDLLARLFKLTTESPYTGQTESLAATLGADEFIVDLPDGVSRPRNVVEPVLDEVLVVPSERRDDWWQRFEVLRNAYLLMGRPDFDSAYRGYAEAVRAVAQERRSVQRFRDNGELQTAELVERGAKHLEPIVEERLRDAVKLAVVGRVHVRAAMMGRSREYVVPGAEQMAAELRADGQAHPLVTSGFVDEGLALECAIRSVSAAWGALGREQAWGTLRGGVGVIPTEVWLDSE